jgi:hypothetical protein
VVSRRSISAHQTQFLLLPGRRTLLLLGIAETVDRVAVDATWRRQIFPACVVKKEQNKRIKTFLQRNKTKKKNKMKRN